jgi:hypothetical protein
MLSDRLWANRFLLGFGKRDVISMDRNDEFFVLTFPTRTKLHTRHSTLWGFQARMSPFVDLAAQDNGRGLTASKERNFAS